VPIDETLAFLMVFAAFQPLLEVLAALGHLLACLPYNYRHKHFVNPVALEVELDGDIRLLAILERLDGDIDICPNRAVYATNSPRPRRSGLCYFRTGAVGTWFSAPGQSIRVTASWPWGTNVRCPPLMVQISPPGPSWKLLPSRGMRLIESSA
jgi:hypothetical protein